MSFRASFLLALVLTLALVPLGLVAQAPAPAGATVHGMVVDPDTALVPGATVTLTLTPANKAQTTESKSDGTYTFRGVAPGTYVLTVTAPGFAAFVKEGVKVAAGQNLSLDATLIIAEQSQQMTVQADSPSLSVDPENNATTTVITGAALDALSDDPDELSAELSALAGPSAGPNGGQIYIDGFTGGQLPPKSSILAIRINSNPFSAQYDQLGYGRIEILTKPGTDKFHGNASIQFGDKFLNTSTPFLGAANNQPDYHTIFFTGNVTGPLRKGMSFTVGGSYRDIAQNDIVNPTDIYSTGPTSTTLCAPGLSTLGTCGAYPYPAVDRAFANPQKRADVTPRVDMLVGPKNTLTVRYAYETSNSTNNICGNGACTTLPTDASNSSSSENTIQISDTQLISNKVINETRFEYQRDYSSSSPINTAPTVSVSGIFTGGGSQVGTINNTTSTHYEVQNYTSIQLVKNFLRLGGRLRTTGEAVSTNSSTNGVISYSYLLDPCTDPTITNKPTTCQAATTPCAAANTNPLTPISSYQCGIPFQFTVTKINNLTINARQTDGGFYAEDDWKAKNNLTISYGVRMEVQNYINSTHDFAPRTSIAYGIPRKNGRTTTVLRAGYGVFFNRFSLGSISNLIQNNGLNQNDLIYQFPGMACTPTNIAGCTTGSGTVGKTTNAASPPGELRSAYTMQTAATLEQQIGKYTSATVTYLNSRGEHQFMTRVFPTTSNLCGQTSSFTGYVDCSESAGVFRENQIITSANIRTPKGLTLGGNYSMSWGNSNISGITNPYNSATDYGRAGFAVRSRFTLFGSIPLPWRVTASPSLYANSGSPYSITTGVDENLDGVNNDRPSFLPGASSANCKVANSFYSPPASTSAIQGENYTEIPVNYCTGPANVAFNLRLSRTWGFGPKTEAALRQQARGGAGGGGGAFGGIGGAGGPGGGPGGGGGGARGGGGGGGGPRGGGGLGSNTGRKYNLTVGAFAQNLFNEVPYAAGVSTLTNPQFGKQISLQGGVFSSNNAVRRITLQANFSF